ncbi:MAG TPA: uroporphyrinogen decarboxylase family protein [bacterium]|nr:uroporphyrinogen decarboxylase family protein [bacterium]HPN45504.1 uroporphyrinogen decarboxylase family protein [bacterium]
MTGKQLVTAAMQRRPVERVPWVPFVGCHGGALINVSARDYLTNRQHIENGIRAAIRSYRPDGIPVAFDLQIEAEILGCNLVWADENPPAVASHPLAEGKSLQDLHIPLPSEGRLPIMLGAAQTIRAEFPDIALYGAVTGPFTLAMHLAGTDLFMHMYEDPEAVQRLIDFCRDVCMAITKYYSDAGCDVIAVVDPLTSQISEEQFRQFVAGPAAEIFRHIKKLKRLGSFFVCGHARHIIQAMAECKPDNVSIDENIPLDYVRDICARQGISFGGNLQLTITLLLGDETDAQRNAMECLQIAGNTGFILAPGCDLPYATPPANLKAVTNLLHNPYQQQVIITLEKQPSAEAVPDMSDYGVADKVIIDIITLDSESCAPCQYMVEAVKQVAPHFEAIVEWHEHKIKHQESIQFMTALMVKNIPTICIDGKITFVSRIPGKQELIQAIQNRINEKLYHKIRIRKGSVFILGRTSEEILKLRPEVDKAIRELGADVPVVEITDNKEIASFGVSRTPAIVTAIYKIRSEAKIPPALLIKEWVKDLL